MKPTKILFSRWPAIIALITFSGALSISAQSPSGSFSKPSLPPGTVGLACGGSVPQFDLQVPDTKREAASELAVKTGWSWGRDLHEGLVGNELDAIGIYIRMGLTPLGMAGGAAYGAIIGESKHKLRPALAEVTRAMAELQVQDALRKELLLLVQQKCVRPVMLLTNSFPAEDAFRVPSLMDAYAPLPSDSQPDNGCDPRALTGIDSLVLIRVINQGLSGRDGPNSRLSLNMALRATLIRTSDRTQMFGFYATYDSRSHKFVEWANSGAQLFRSEFESALQSLANQIVVESGLHLPPPPAAPPIRIVQNR